jgi:hypothetical protein
MASTWRGQVGFMQQTRLWRPHYLKIVKRNRWHRLKTDVNNTKIKEFRMGAYISEWNSWNELVRIVLKINQYEHG